MSGSPKIPVVLNLSQLDAASRRRYGTVTMNAEVSEGVVLLWSNACLLNAVEGRHRPTVIHGGRTYRVTGFMPVTDERGGLVRLVVTMVEEP